MIAIGKDDFDAFKKIIKKIRKYIEGNAWLQNRLKELLVKQFIVKNNVITLLEGAVDSYAADFNIDDLLGVDGRVRNKFLREFRTQLLNQFQIMFDDKQKQELFIQLDLLLGKVLSKRAVS